MLSCPHTQAGMTNTGRGLPAAHRDGDPVEGARGLRQAPESLLGLCRHSLVAAREGSRAQPSGFKSQPCFLLIK